MKNIILFKNKSFIHTALTVFVKKPNYLSINQSIYFVTQSIMRSYNKSIVGKSFLPIRSRNRSIWKSFGPGFPLISPGYKSCTLGNVIAGSNLEWTLIGSILPSGFTSRIDALRVIENIC